MINHQEIAAKVAEVKKDFPTFFHYPGLAYLDNAATSQMPQAVIDTLHHSLVHTNANIHRGVYRQSAQATQLYEECRIKVANFLNAEGGHCIAFTKGTTESINVVASSWLKPRIQAGDNVVITLMEHHANILPWQHLCNQVGATLRVVPVDEKGELMVNQLIELMDNNTRLLAITHLSNTLGTVNPIGKIIARAKHKQVPVLVDAAQSAALHHLDLQALQPDFLTFSAHKMFGPFGVGILYVHPDHHRNMQPYSLGGGMVKDVFLDYTDYQNYPFSLDAGTPNVSGVITLGATIDYLNQLNRDWAVQHVNHLTHYCVNELEKIPGVHLVGNSKTRSGVVSFVVENIHPHDLASFYNNEQIAVRAGQHCTQPLLDSLNVPATVRASFSIYNDETEVERLVKVTREIIDLWQ